VALVKCIASFSYPTAGGPRTIAVGELLDESDPAVTARRTFFAPTAAESLTQTAELADGSVTAVKLSTDALAAAVAAGSGTYVRRSAMRPYLASDHGAVFDAKRVTDGSIASGTSVLTSPSAGFTTSDIGKSVQVTGAGTSGAPLVTTIEGYTSATQVTLAAPAATTVLASRTVADGAITIGTRVLTSATANFTAGDIGKTIAVTGAGAGNALSGRIDTVDSSTQVKLDTAASTTVTGASTTIAGAGVTYGTNDAPAIQAALDAAVAAGASGGRVIIDGAMTLIATGLTCNGYPFVDGVDNGGVVIEGVGVRSTKVYAIGSITAFTLGGTSRMYLPIRNIEIVGPGKMVAGSRGIYTSPNIQGSSVFSDVYVHHFETGWDTVTTLCTYQNVNVRYCQYGFKTGYNGDVNTWINGRFDYCDVALYLGWQITAHNTQNQDGQGFNFIGCRMSNNTGMAFLINDAIAAGINFQGVLFESNPKEGEIGISGGLANGPVGVSFIGCAFTPVDTKIVPVGIDVFSKGSLEFRNCSNGGVNGQYDVFVRMNNAQPPAQCVFDRCYLQNVTADVQYGGRNYKCTTSQNEFLSVGRSEITHADGAYIPSGTGIWKQNILSARTGKVYESWQGVTSTGVLTTEIQMRDVGGVQRLEGTLAGGICATNAAALPTASVNYRGMIYRVDGGAGVADLFYVCQKSAADTYSWKLLSTG
jgi:hypothetical protein